MKFNKLNLLTYDKLDELKALKAEKNKEELELERLRNLELDELERQINEGIENGTIPAVAYRKITTDKYSCNEEPMFLERTLCEETKKYNYNETKTIDKPHDKLIKTILSSEEEVSKVIKKYLNIEIREDNLEKYTSSYISKDYEALESDIVYKMKTKKIYFLIEHQSKIDRSMPYRISQYIAAIMKEAVKKDKTFEDGYLYPRVIPIVIYTGNKKWNVATSLSEVQEKLEGYEQIDNSYKLIDANNYTEEELINDETIISKAMLVERSKTKEEIEKAINKIILKITKENEIESIYNFLNYIWSERLDKDTVKALSQKLKEKGVRNMTGLEILYNEYDKKFNEARNEGKREGILEGRREGKREGEIKIVKIIKNMLKRDLSIKDISNLTGINEKQIMKIKNEIESIV